MDEVTTELLDRIRRYALPTPIEARGAWLRQRGAMRLGRERGWSPFHAEQQFSVEPPGFQWKARIRVAPFVSVSVTDAYEESRGFLRVSWFGIPLSRASGPEMSAGELMRFLAELAWCPPAYANPKLTWSATGDRTLEVELREGETSARVALDVDDLGRIVACRARRLRLVGKRFEDADWHAEFGEYRQFGALRMPSRGEASWELPEGRFTYWRGEIVDAGLVAA